MGKVGLAHNIDLRATPAAATRRVQNPKPEAGEKKELN